MTATIVIGYTGQRIGMRPRILSSCRRACPSVRPEHRSADRYRDHRHRYSSPTAPKTQTAQNRYAGLSYSDGQPYTASIVRVPESARPGVRAQGHCRHRRAARLAGPRLQLRPKRTRGGSVTRWPGFCMSSPADEVRRVSARGMTAVPDTQTSRRTDDKHE
jgi:hypothetical protein